MLRLDLFASPHLADVAQAELSAMPGVRHVTSAGTTAGGKVAIAAEVDATVADAAVERLAALGVEPSDLRLWRMQGIEPLRWSQHAASTSAEPQVWSEIVGRAHENAEMVSSYLIFMVAAGVIAGIGVLTGSAVLIVGAMALSPDLLPISACAIGIVERRHALALRALRALSVGLAAGMLGAFAATVVLRVAGRIPDDLILADTMMGEVLTTLGPESLIVAATAGVAGMMAFERPSGAAVGVAISVTTIPAASYVGAAMAMGRDDPMWGALVVLLSNVTMLLLASSITLVLQRRARMRRAARASVEPSADDAT